MTFNWLYLKQNYSLSPIKKIFALGVILSLFSCVTEKQHEKTFFSGKIKNPKDDYVYFLKNETVIDSAQLNKQSKFKFELDSIDEGLYTFKHGPEFQYIYLEPQDSLLLYLNTWDFDESLVFSGSGGAKNNYLINLYLLQEKKEKDFQHNFRLNQKEFDSVIGLEIDEHLKIYQEFVNNEPEAVSPFFEKLAMVGIYYPYYYKKEYYPFYHKKALGLKAFPKIDDSFYEYRENIDLNDEGLLTYGPYMTYLHTYLRHLAWITKMNNPDKNNMDLNFMEAVNHKIKIPSQKNKLLAKGAWNALVYDDLTQEERDTILSYFFANCHNEMICREIKTALSQREKLKSGDTLPNIITTNFQGESVALNEITDNKVAVVYFWPKELNYVEIVSEKLKHLQRKHPEIVFVGIDRNKSDQDWKSFINKKKLDQKTQLKLAKNSNYYPWFEGNSDRTLIVDENGVVKNGYLFFSDKYFEQYLKDLQK